MQEVGDEDNVRIRSLTILVNLVTVAGRTILWVLRVRRIDKKKGGRAKW